MSQETVEQLEKLLRTLINTKYKSTLPTEEEFLQAADQFRNSLQLIAPVTDEEYESKDTVTQANCCKNGCRCLH